MLNYKRKTEKTQDETKKIKIEKIKIAKIDDGEVFKVSIQGLKHAEGIKMLKSQVDCPIRKLNENEYIVKSTGEIKEFQRADDKQIQNIRQTFKRLMGLIRTNFDGGENQLFVTLTYRENMIDEKRLMHDFKAFVKRLKYHYSEHELEYLSVAEPQERGAWHLHMMIKSTNKPVLYMDHADIERIWGHGYTRTERLKSDDIGAYYVAYFTDLVGSDKARKKGERLGLYPKGLRFYRRSQGLDDPQVAIMTHKDLVERYGNPTFVSAFEVQNHAGENVKILNRIVKTSFKRKDVCEQ